MDIDELQKIMKEWQDKNFPPEKQTLELLTLGVAEKAGELAHAVLKFKQSIRESDRDDIIDAACDNIIYCLQVLSCVEARASQELKYVNNRMLRRDWSKNPKGGNDEEA